MVDCAVSLLIADHEHQNDEKVINESDQGWPHCIWASWNAFCAQLNSGRKLVRYVSSKAYTVVSTVFNIVLRLMCCQCAKIYCSLATD